MMNDSTNPAVTVLMSCYNGGRWLAAAIESVLAQTFDDFEFILVDDGSSDDTRDIIRNYQRRDGRIIAIFKENTGLADSLNVGIERAKGEWIARIDQDDLCEPERLDLQLAYVRNHPEVVLLGTGFVEIDAQGRTIKQHTYAPDHDSLARNLAYYRCFFPHSSAFYRLDAVQKVGGYNTHYSRAEDRKLWLELVSLGKLACLPLPLVKVRKHAQQMSLDENGRRQFCDGMAATVSFFLLKAGCPDPSTYSSDVDWLNFIRWIEKKVDDDGVFERHASWMAASSDFYSSGGGANGLLRFCLWLMRSGHAVLMMKDRLYGSTLPQKLARKWLVDAGKSCGFAATGDGAS